MITRDLLLENIKRYFLMKLYKFNVVASTSIPSTKTIVSFVRAMLKMHKEGHSVFTALDVMNYALDNGLWSTTQLTDEKRMTTWAFYVKKLKAIGLEECGETSSGSKKMLTIDDLLEEFEMNSEEESEDEIMAKLEAEEALQAAE